MKSVIYLPGESKSPRIGGKNALLIKLLWDYKIIYLTVFNRKLTAEGENPEEKYIFQNGNM